LILSPTLFWLVFCNFLFFSSCRDVHVSRAVARLSEQTRQVLRAPKVRASMGGSGGLLPRKILKSTLSGMLFSASFHVIFLQNSVSLKCKKARFFCTFNIFLYPLLGRVPEWYQVDGYPEFCIVLIHPHPHLPAPLLVMASFQFLTHANTMLL